VYPASETVEERKQVMSTDLMAQVYPIFELVLNKLIRQKCEPLRALGTKTVNKEIARREKAHGPCPEEVKWHFHLMFLRFVGDQLYRNGRIPEECYPNLEIPEKGTSTRKLYDNWMKQKKSR